MTIIARFHPQAWINDYAVEVDPEGETEFDVTPEILVKAYARGSGHAMGCGGTAGFVIEQRAN